MSLRSKLIIISLLTSIIPLLLLGFFTYKYVSGILQEELSQNELKHLYAMDNQVSYFLKDIEQMSLFFTYNDQIISILNNESDRDALKKNDDYLTVDILFDTVMGVKDWDINIYIIGENGDRYFSNNYLPQEYNDIRNYWGIFRKANLANGALEWDTNYSVSTLNTNDVVLSAGRLIKDNKTDTPLGYIIIDINEAALSSLYERNDFLPNEQFL